MSGLTFTDEAACHLEKTYSTEDIVAQRLETIRHLNLSAGERVLDVGCGPGFLCEQMGEIVGRCGAVVGIDISRDLLALCDRRKHSAWLSYEVGDATKLRYPDGSFDVVVCTQVAEYIPDWDALVWFSEDANRMAAVLRSWEAHCSHPRLPRTMPHRLKNAGFRLDAAFVYSLLNLSYDEDSYSKGLSTIIKKFVGERGDVSASDLNDWLNEFDRLNEAGRYFFSSNRYIFKAARPAR